MNLTLPNTPIRLVTSRQSIEPGHGIFVTVEKKKFLLAAMDRRIAFLAA
jgi:hypothetical protein